MEETIKKLICAVLMIDEGSISADKETPLLGSIPELDSMAVVAIITTMEEQFSIAIDDDEISAETFSSIGSLSEFVESKK